jgi:hypothetical protein
MTCEVRWGEWFYYDESSPSCLKWKVSRYAGGLLLVSAGDTAGTIGGQDYYRVQLNKKIYHVHRIIWEMFNGEIPEGMEIDHEDLNKVNNKIDNLRLVTKQINCRNRSLRKDSTSGINGVFRRERLLPSGTLYSSWDASYLDIDGRDLTKSFSTNKYGEDVAKQLAIEFIEYMKNKNKEVDGFTDRHGK